MGDFYAREMKCKIICTALQGLLRSLSYHLKRTFGVQDAMPNGRMPSVFGRIGRVYDVGSWLNHEEQLES